MPVFGTAQRLLMVLGIVLSALFGSKAEADTRKGIAAYQQGDYVTAFKELDQAARVGDAQAYYNLGIFYQEGKAQPRNLEQAFAMYKRGAEKGSVLAAFNLGQAYRKGEGIAVNYTEAARWYEFAAKRGDYRAGNELGILYVEGKGVRTDKIEGFAWIYTGTHMDIMDDKALTNALQLASTMNREEMQVAQGRGRSYYQRYIKPNQNVVRTILKQPS
ncbi:sel1 repeat family protein [Microvirga sp. ACRRW]|uniref:tetratricopeptide repeat protein n=1 Tax=Microvirga sp. ACRRW TaxID=2918205 RepID=UPI001EF4BE74|nr:tetratricopeptide repeat protein [Microvirga sp. ACRRW]MCG7392759.1 sel1 repeat family protein [Microvirga sp. ACRRW]